MYAWTCHRGHTLKAKAIAILFHPINYECLLYRNPSTVDRRYSRSPAKQFDGPIDGHNLSLEQS